MTDRQKSLIDWKDENELKQQISILECSKVKDKEELLTYCYERLRVQDRTAAMIETNSEVG